MTRLSATLLGLCAFASIHCQGSVNDMPQPRAVGSGGTDAGIGAAGGTRGSPGTAGATATATGGSIGTAGTAGTADGGTAVPGTGGITADAGVIAADGGAAMPGTGAATGDAGPMSIDAGTLRQGSFKMIVLTTAIIYKHDSIPACLQMLIDLGKQTAPERTKIPGLAPDSTWTVDQIASDPSKPGYFSEVTAANLKNYELFYSDNPNGPVFTDAPGSAQKKQAFVDYWMNGGSWAGQHSATDFEKNGQWTWFQDNVNGGWFVDHDFETTNGTVTWQAEYVNHPILKGLTSPWSVADEWYIMNRNIEAVNGFRVLAKVTVSSSPKGTSPRPAVWITENGNGGRAFYTIRGHNRTVYAEQEFRELMLRGILWSVHRLPGD